MHGVVLEQKGHIEIRDIEINEELSPDDVRIKPVSVGICGSDIHYYSHGRIGDFVVNEPMVLGHEASGIIIEKGSNVKNLNIGDRVCVEPGIPDFRSKETLDGMYNLDPSVRFWATPPIHGCLRDTVIHPAGLCFKLPENVSFDEGALVEPLAIGVYSVQKSGLKSGDTAIVIGAGTIGLVTALAAEAAGCARVFLLDVKQEKLDFAEEHYGDKLTIVNSTQQNIGEVLKSFDLSAVDMLFEASGSPRVFPTIANHVLPGGTIMLVGMPPEPVPVDVVALQAKEITLKTIFRYVNIFPKAVKLIASGKINVKPLITSSYSFDESKEAFEYAATQPGKEVKILIRMPEKL